MGHHGGAFLVPARSPRGLLDPPRDRSSTRPRPRRCCSATRTWRPRSPEPSKRRGIQQDPVRIAQTQADVARVPTLAQQVLTQNIKGHGADAAASFLGESSVSASSDADILTFNVTNHDRRSRSGSSTPTRRLHGLPPAARYEAIVARARIVEQRIAQLEAGRASRPLHEPGRRDQTLADDGGAPDLERLGYPGRRERRPRCSRGRRATPSGSCSGSSSASRSRSSGGARHPRPHRRGHRRAARRPPLLARIPGAEQEASLAANRLAMIDHPRGKQAEAFRVLRTNLEFVRLDRDARRSGHERGRAGRQVDDDRQPRGRARPRGQARRARRPRPAPALLDKFFDLSVPG